MTTLTAVVFAYALGCVATGYYIVRALTGEDVRSHATGSSGARNVARRTGIAAAAATFAADLGKGAAAVATLATRAFTASGLVGAVTAPVAALALRERGTALAAGLAAALIVAAHARRGPRRGSG